MEIQEKTRDEKVASLEHEINTYIKPRISEFGEAGRKVASGEECSRPGVSEYRKPYFCDEVRNSLGDGINSIMGISKIFSQKSETEVEYPKEMVSEAKRLLNRESLIYSDHPGPVFQGEVYGGEGRHERVREYFSGLVEAAKAPFFARCAALMKKELALYEGELEALREE